MGPGPFPYMMGASMVGGGGMGGGGEEGQMKGNRGGWGGGGKFVDVSSFEGGCGKSAGEGGNRISGGGKAKKHAFPWVVRIMG